MTKEKYYNSVSNSQFLEDVETFDSFFSLFDDCYHFVAIALKQLSGDKRNPYAIKVCLYGRRYWQVIDSMNKILDMPYSDLSWYIENMRPLVKKECEKEFVDIEHQDFAIEVLNSGYKQLCFKFEG